jgi:hypothetical protein
LSTGIGTVNVDGRLQVSERGGRFRGLTVRLQEIPSEVEQQLRNQLGRMLNQRIPQGGEDIAFELTGSIDDPSVRPIQ